MTKLRIATAQFPVRANISRNLKYMIDLTKKSVHLGADVVHFSEACLGGYAGTEFEAWDEYDWTLLASAEQNLELLARDCQVNIIYGTNHCVNANDIRNRLNCVSDKGKLVASYDKRFCTRGDLKFYKSGRQFTTFTINGFGCGLQICYDVRFPELYREYKKRKTDIMFHSFYNARVQGKNIHTTIMRPTLQARAATNYIYISANNSSGYYQSWPSVFILPNGVIAKSCPQHRTGLIINEISSEDTYYDASEPYRDKAMAGVLYSK